jgi:hypothetical protein
VINESCFSESAYRRENAKDQRTDTTPLKGPFVKRALLPIHIIQICLSTPPTPHTHTHPIPGMSFEALTFLLEDGSEALLLPIFLSPTDDKEP